MRSVRRFAIAVIACALALSASGAFSLILSEPCIGYELADGGQDDGACPPTCVTCGCCARAVELVMAAVAVSPDPVVTGVEAALPRFPNANPDPIPHVPKPLFA